MQTNSTMKQYPCAHCKTGYGRDEWQVSKIAFSQVVSKKQLFGSDKGLVYTGDPVHLLKYAADTGISPQGAPVLLLQPNYQCIFGPYYLYWYQHRSKPKTIILCSRKCAIDYAKHENVVLTKSTDSLSITPHQNVFDQYAKLKRLDSYLVGFDGDDWVTPDTELRSLLALRLPHHSARRLRDLIEAVAALGLYELAEKGVWKILEIDADYLAKVPQLFGFIGDPFKIGKIADQVYQRALNQSNGSYSLLGAGIIATWAMLLVSDNSRIDKAVTLSRIAFELEPQNDDILANHLMILNVSHDPQALAFLEANYQRLQTHNHYFSAGQIYQSNQLNAKALECLRVADTFWPDAMTKVHLAQVLFAQERYPEALEQARLGRRSIYDGAGEYTDQTGKTLHYTDLSPLEKEYTEQLLLIVEGKALYRLGEERMGRKKIQDAARIAELAPKIQEEIRPYVGEVMSYDGLLEAKAFESSQLANAHQEILQARTQRQELAELLKVIGDTQLHWREELETLSVGLSHGDIDEKFSDYIHACATRIASLRPVDYAQVHDSCRKLLASLPDGAIGLIASAHYLFDLLGNTDQPVYASVIVELSKALEWTLNEVLVVPFAQHLVANGRGTRIVGVTPSGQDRPISLVLAGEETKHLMLADLAYLSVSNDSAWRHYNSHQYGPSAEWIFSDLPTIVLDVKDKYRNGCAHSSTAHQAKAQKLFDYLEEKRVFQCLDEFARATSPART